MYRDKQLRELAVKYRETHTQKETCEAFEISASALKSWRKRLKESGSLKNKALNRKGRKIDPEKLRQDVEGHPDDFNDERAQRFNCSAEAIRLALKKHGITKKKSAICGSGYEEAGKAYLEETEHIPSKKRVYADESGIKKGCQREYAYAPRGKKVHGVKKAGKGKSMNIIRRELQRGAFGGKDL